MGLLPLAAVTAGSCWLIGFRTSYLAQVAGLYAIVAAVIVCSLPEDHPGPGLGAANCVTLLRATLVLPIAALVPAARALTGSAYWWIVALAAAALVSDGVDGIVARRTGTASAFGARFDMELDAFLLVVLSALLWRSGKVGVWVLLIGALRYLFLGAGWLWWSLRAELSPSARRKTVCVVQGVALVVCLAPVISAAVALALASAALALLVYSFAADVRWLVQRR